MLGGGFCWCPHSRPNAHNPLPIRGRDRLTALALDRTAITDQGLAQFAQPGGLRNVQHLYLAETAVTDEGVRHLESIPHLLGVALHETQVTMEMVRRLKQRPELYWITPQPEE